MASRVPIVANAAGSHQNGDRTDSNSGNNSSSNVLWNNQEILSNKKVSNRDSNIGNKKSDPAFE